MADGVTDPRIIIQGGGGSEQVTGNTFAGEFTFDGEGIDYQNVSGQTFLSLILTFTPDGNVGAFSCAALSFFSSCSVDGDTVTFSGGSGIPSGSGENTESISSFAENLNNCGIEDTSHFEVVIEGLPQGTSTSFDAVANSTVPEPASVILIATGLAGFAGLRKRRSQAKAV